MRCWPESHLAETRSLQDWWLRYGLSKAEGVAEIAGVGGFVSNTMWWSTRNA